jgi:predicted transcriptional regulator
MFELVYLPTENQQTYLNPTAIAKRLGFKSAIQVNKLLTKLGLQTNHRDTKNRLHYVLTTKGFKYAQYQDAGRKYSSGTPIRTIKWLESVLKLLQPTTPEIFRLT